MKALIAIISSENVLSSLFASLEMQKRWPIDTVHRRIIITDRKVMGLGIEMIVDPAISGPGGYAHSRARNHAIRAARDSDCDYLVMVDSDTVFLGFQPGAPIADFERLRLFFQKQGEVITDEVLRDPDRVQWGSFWIFGRAVFEQDWCESCEGFLGYGWEDYDFVFNVLEPRGYKITNSSAAAIHLWHHPKRNRNDAEFDAEFLRNKRLYENRRIIPTRAKIPVAPPGQAN